MRQGDWDEIVQHPDRPLTRGQVELIGALNLAALTRERQAALLLRLIIEVRRLVPAPLPSQFPRPTYEEIGRSGIPWEPTQA